MKMKNKIAHLTPYFYFIVITLYWFTNINRSEGIKAYPILIFAFPFLWQILKPNKTLNLTIGITFTCLSSYIILAYLSELLNITSIWLVRGFIFYGGIFVILNFVMSAWIIRNSLKRTF